MFVEANERHWSCVPCGFRICQTCAVEIMQGAPFERMEVGGTEQRGEVCYVCKCVWCSLCKCVCVCGICILGIHFRMKKSLSS